MKSWLELEERFREIKEPLKYLRLDIQWGSAGEHWSITGMPHSHESSQFELLAGVCGRLLEECFDHKSPPGKLLLSEPNTKIRWYKALKELSRSTETTLPVYELDEAGNRTGTIYCGSIGRVVDVSANLCLLMHAEHPIQDRRNFFSKLYANYGKEIVIGSIIAVITAIIGFFFG